MSPQQIDSLVNNGCLPGSDSPEGRQLIETHISWVILTSQFAYKIKKPVRFSFLDFSTPERRKTACEEELRLNRRLSDIYLDVVPVVFDGQQ
jgi:aminoglycoside phosphotransferase family enzyme